ncbi:MAG: hypothetical protein AB9872_03490 [Solidesulfovibrio sp.]
MATRSRLGRDPLRDVAKPAAAKAGTKPKSPAKAASQGRPTPKTTVKTKPPRATPVNANKDKTPPVPAAAATVAKPDAEPKAAENSASPEVTSVADVPGVADQKPLPATSAASVEVEVAPRMARDATLLGQTAAPPAITQETHPIEVFFSGVLEGLLPEDGVQFSIAVDPEASSLPVEKLFYFSHVLQLLVTPLDWPGRPWRRIEGTAEHLPTLTAHLTRCAEDRHTLRLYDNGLFFRSYLPELHIGMEALRPLIFFVLKRHGSICIKQGRAIEFEIIG